MPILLGGGVSEVKDYLLIHVKIWKIPPIVGHETWLSEVIDIER